MQFRITAHSTKGQQREIEIFALSFDRAERIAKKLSKFFDLGKGFKMKSYNITPLKANNK